jgi:hypothetical protein
MVRKFKLITISLSVIVIGSCQDQMGNIKLSGDYWYKTIDCGECRMIFSRERYYNAIYPTVTDYAFNENFILAEQRPAKETYIYDFGEDLFRRFENYRIYKTNNNILNDSFHSKLRGFVEKDSLLYRQFMEMGASKDELKNRVIGIDLAKSLIQNDSFYIKIFSNKLNYWIICNSSDSLIGPLTRQEYLDKKNILVSCHTLIDG